MKFVFLILFVSFSVYFAIFALKTIKAQIARVFTENYAKLKQTYPTPLHTWGWVMGAMWNDRWPTLRGSFKVDVYDDMVIVSMRNKGMCLRYDQYVFKQKKGVFSHYLVIENLPIQRSASISPVEEPTEDLWLYMSSDKINIILKLAQQKQ